MPHYGGTRLATRHAPAAASGPQTISTIGEAHTAYNTSTLGRYGLQFTPTASGTVTAAVLSGTDSAGPQNWTAQIYTNSSGSPGSTVGSASAPVAEVAHPSTHSFTLSTAVTGGTTYWVVFARAVSTSKMSICAAVGGIVTGGDASSPTSITDGSNIDASSDVRCSVTITP